MYGPLAAWFLCPKTRFAAPEGPLHGVFEGLFEVMGELTRSIRWGWANHLAQKAYLVLDTSVTRGWGHRVQDIPYHAG